MMASENIDQVLKEMSFQKMDLLFVDDMKKALKRMEQLLVTQHEKEVTTLKAENEKLKKRIDNFSLDEAVQILRTAEVLENVDDEVAKAVLDSMKDDKISANQLIENMQIVKTDERNKALDDVLQEFYQICGVDDSPKFEGEKESNKLIVYECDLKELIQKLKNNNPDPLFKRIAVLKETK